MPQTGPLCRGWWWGSLLLVDPSWQSCFPWNLQHSDLVGALLSWVPTQDTLTWTRSWVISFAVSAGSVTMFLHWSYNVWMTPSWWLSRWWKLKWRCWSVCIFLWCTCIFTLPSSLQEIIACKNGMLLSVSSSSTNFILPVGSILFQCSVSASLWSFLTTLNESSMWSVTDFKHSTEEVVVANTVQWSCTAFHRWNLFLWALGTLSSLGQTTDNPQSSHKMSDNSRRVPDGQGPVLPPHPNII